MVTDEMVEKAADEMARQDITFANCDRGWQKRTIRAALEAALCAAEPVALRENDAVWARFYRDGKTLGEICSEFKCGIYELSPWLTAPLLRSALSAQVQDVAMVTRESALKAISHVNGNNGRGRREEAVMMLAAAPAKQEGGANE